MWGAGIIVIGAIAPLVVGVLFVLINSNADAIQQTRKVVARNERMVAHQMGRIDHTLTVISINQIRQMRELGIDYIDPPSIYPEEEE